MEMDELLERLKDDVAKEAILVVSERYMKELGVTPLRMQMAINTLSRCGYRVLTAGAAQVLVEDGYFATEIEWEAAQSFLEHILSDTEQMTEQIDEQKEGK